MVEKLSSVFPTRFEDFQNRLVDFKILAHLFDLAAENIPDCFELKVQK